MSRLGAAISKAIIFTSLKNVTKDTKCAYVNAFELIFDEHINIHPNTIRTLRSFERPFPLVLVLIDNELDGLLSALLPIAWAHTVT